MHDLDRRSLLGFLGVALVEFAAGCSSLRRPVRSAASDWLSEIDSVCAELRSGAISQLHWQSATEATLRGADLSTILAELEFERIVANLFPYRILESRHNDSRGPPFEIHNIDPQAGRRINASEWMVPKLNVEDALRKYGKSNWEFTV